MTYRLNNDWLAPVINNWGKKGRYNRGELVFGAADARDEILNSIKQFKGTKVFLSCTPHTPIKKVLKKALCFTDSVIIVPAPMIGSCFLPEECAEFSRGGHGDADLGDGMGWFTDSWVAENVSRLLYYEPELVKDGAVTFLPILGSHTRWRHPSLNLPELPYPYSDGGYPGYTSKGKYNAITELMFNLCTERLVAEELGATHLNVHSFKRPVLTDLELRPPVQDESWTKAVLKVRVPALDTLSLSDILALRRELAEPFKRFSKKVISELKIKDKGRNFNERVESVSSEIEDEAFALDQQIQEFKEKSLTLKSKAAFKISTFLLSTGGELGSIAATIGFLMGGGAVWDLMDLAIHHTKVKMQLQSNSFFFVAEMIRRDEQIRANKGITILGERD